MDIKDDGGPAFPLTTDMAEFFALSPDAKAFGMTLRDYFAAKAMQGLLACPIQPQSSEKMFAKDAYIMADAMLAARK